MDKKRGIVELIGEFALIIDIFLSGFLFLFILILNLAMGALGYLMEKDDYDPDADLKKINKDLKKFKMSIVLALIEHGSVVALAVLLFIVFSTYGIILGIVWAICRTGEGLIQFYNEPYYWRLLKIARQYSGASGAEKNSLSNLARTIFKAKDRRFKYAMILWAIGTFTFSIVLVTSGVVPQFIGWLGIVTSILIGFGNGIKLLKPKFKVPIISALLAIIFEVIIGGWLVYYSII